MYLWKYNKKGCFLEIMWLIKLAPLVREISWSNNIIIMEKCKDDLQREFYIQMTKRYGWTKRVLTNFIEAQTYEKYLLNQTNFDLTLTEERRVQAKLAVKDEYTFDFAELSPEYSEHELEERTKEKPSNTNNTSELENNNGETMMYMVNKLNQNKEEEK